jgi:neutral ceramidase
MTTEQRTFLRLSACAALLAVALLTPALHAQTSFRVGVAKKNITPCPLNFPQPCPEAYIPVTPSVITTGGGAAMATGVINDYDGTPSDLTVRALLLEDADHNRALVITADLLGFSAEFVKDVRARISREIAGLAPQAILINASHTHNAPAVKHLVGVACTSLAAEAVPMPVYVEAVKQRMVAAATDAASAMQAVTLHFGTGSTSVGGYRRQDQPPGYPPFQTPYPQTLHVLQAKSGSSVIATLFSVGVHPHTQFGGGYLTADFPSDTRKLLETANPGSVALFVQGFGGDINPIGNKVQLGQDLAASVSSAASSAVVLQGALAASSATVRLPVNANTPSWALPTSAAFRSWMHDGMPELPVELQMIRIGGDPSKSTSWTLLASAHEVVSEYGPKVRAKIPERVNLTLAGYSNAVESYLPTERMMLFDRSSCGLWPNGYEGCGSFHLYYRGLPAWTDNAFLEPIAALSRELDDTLVDDFQAATRDSKKWNNHVLARIGCDQPHDAALSLSQGGGELQVAPLNAAAGYHYNGYVSARTFDFRGRQATVEIKGFPTGAAAEMLMSVGPHGQHLYRFNVQGTSGGVQLYAHYWTADGNPRYFPAGSYNATTQRFLRIRHDAPTDQMRWETSPDGVSWTQVFSWPREFDLSAVRAELTAGSWQSSPNPGVARFGSFSLR